MLLLALYPSNQVILVQTETIQHMDRWLLSSNAGVGVMKVKVRNFSISQQDHAELMISMVMTIVCTIQCTRDTNRLLKLISTNYSALLKTMIYMVTSTVILLRTLSSNLRNVLGRAVNLRLRQKSFSCASLFSQCRMVKSS